MNPVTWRAVSVSIADISRSKLPRIRTDHKMNTSIL